MSDFARHFGIPIPIDEETGFRLAVFQLVGADNPPEGFGSDAYEALLDEVSKKSNDVLHLSEKDALRVVNLALKRDAKAWEWAFASLVHFIKANRAIPEGLRAFSGVIHFGVKPPGRQGRKKTNNEHRNRAIFRAVSLLTELGLGKTNACAIVGRALGECGFGEIAADATLKIVNGHAPLMDDRTYSNRILVSLMTPRKK